MIEIIGKISNKKVATVYLAKTKSNQIIEFVESIQPPKTREEKWVLIVSTLLGCPVACPFCDAGGSFGGKLSKEEILSQIDHLVSERFPNRKIATQNMKIQFARMGEPTLNPSVLDTLEELPRIYKNINITASLSTVAPKSCGNFLEKIMAIKEKYYSQGKFQLQFSIHTTCQKTREKLIPIEKWDFKKIADFGARFYKKNDKKITLNFALAKENPFSVAALKKYFDPNIFLIKITPINPTVKAEQNNFSSYFTNGEKNEDKAFLIDNLKNAGFDVILSIGELEENKIGSNCGQFVKKFLSSEKNGENKNMYTYSIEETKK